MQAPSAGAIHSGVLIRTPLGWVVRPFGSTLLFGADTGDLRSLSLPLPSQTK